MKSQFKGFEVRELLKESEGYVFAPDRGHQWGSRREMRVVTVIVSLY